LDPDSIGSVDPDPERKKLPTTKDNQKGRNFVFLSDGVLFGGLEASPVVLKSFIEA
jgi:hypothetical protein